MPTSSTKKNWIRGGCIGRGSFGSVSLAFDKSAGTVFAVKSVACSNNALSVYSLRSLENEVLIYRSVDSPYVVSYLGDDVTCESSGDICRNLHLEYMPNGTVADVVKTSSGSVAECDVRSYTRCLTEALRYLHDEGIVHGDVKGKNVLVGHSPGSAKLADLGSARRLSDRTGLEVRQGTPLWMAPEVVRGQPQSPESDVWSLGCTVVEMVTGEAPWAKWRCETAEITLFRIGFGEEVLEIPQKMSDSGRDFVGKCLKRNPKERWTCDELLRHPFLAEVEMEQSPRSVFGLIGSEFGFDEDDEEETDWNSSHNSVSSLDAQSRIGGLAAGNRTAGWDDDGEQWEFVRGRESEEIHVSSDNDSDRSRMLLSGTEPPTSHLGPSPNNSCGGKRAESDTGLIGDRIVCRLGKEGESLGLLLIWLVTCSFMWACLIHIICNLLVSIHRLLEPSPPRFSFYLLSSLFRCHFFSADDDGLFLVRSCCAFCGNACQDKEMELRPRGPNKVRDMCRAILVELIANIEVQLKFISEGIFGTDDFFL